MDGCIASQPGQPRLFVSGVESMDMTFRLRSVQDGIMVSATTMLDDDPNMTVRGPWRPINASDQPQPIVLDPKLLTPLTCRLFTNARDHIGHLPWILAGQPVIDGSEEVATKMRALEEAGATVILMRLDPDGHIPIPDVLAELSRRGIKRLMIESGARLTSSLLEASPCFVNCLVVTTGSLFVGNHGRRPPLARSLPRLEHLRTQVFGKDAVVAWQVLPTA